MRKENFEEAREKFLTGFKETNLDYIDAFNEEDIAEIFLSNLSPNWDYRTPYMSRAYPHGVYLNVKWVDIDEDSAMVFYESWANKFADKFKGRSIDLLWVGRSGGWMGFNINELKEFLEYTSSAVKMADQEFQKQWDDPEDDAEYADTKIDWYYRGVDFGLEFYGHVDDSGDNPCDYLKPEEPMLSLMKDFEEDQSSYK